MIKAEIFRNSDFVIFGFRLSGHAGFAEEGDDIVCSAVSMLVINTINCIEEFTNEKFNYGVDNDNGGYIDFSMPDIKKGGKNHDAELLIEAMLYGLNNIEKEYSQYIKIIDEGGVSLC
ncbi:ribosomal-processing cysteine protease Prp [Lachnospiraceae bacterium NSJ-143]|nr:ribosomal-processing cysteine protease Prp [Lachnospiraceae bacterium NSJ-143]